MRDLNMLATTIGFEPEHYGASPNRRDRIAIKCGEQSLTWGQLAPRVHRLARAWENRGFDRGTHIATFLTNRVEVIELMYSLARVAMVNVTINPKFKVDELVHAVLASDANVMVVDALNLAVVDQAMERLPHIDRSHVFVVGGAGIDHDYADFEDLRNSGDDAPIVRTPDEYDILWMAFTGGTTGPAKACMAPHRGMLRLWAAIAKDMGVQRSDTGLIATPLNHSMGMQFGLALLHLGGSLVVLPAFDPVTVLETIEKEKITFFISAPSLFNLMLNAATGEHDMSSMRLVIVGGAAASTKTTLRLLDFFPNADLCSAYGATESGIFAVLYPEDQRRKEMCAGVAPIGVQLKIFDDDGVECAPGQVGTIYGRGWHTGVEYYKNPEATAAAFRGEYHTVEDMGYLDEEGYLFVTDRRKNMIVSSGINVFPTEIENVLTSHPDITEAAVIGIPDETWGELVCAFVVARPGAEVTSSELDTHCRERLARYKVPRRYEFRTDLPRTHAGKLAHRELRAPYWADRTPQN